MGDGGRLKVILDTSNNGAAVSGAEWASSIMLYPCITPVITGSGGASTETNFKS